MAKNLVLTFKCADDTETTITIQDEIAKQDLTYDKAKEAMDNMIASQAFANSKGEIYAQAIKAVYVETTETPIFTV